MYNEDEEGRGHCYFNLGPCSTLIPREDIRLPPCKRWREYLSLFTEEPQEPSQQLNPVPSTHMGITEKFCGLKKKRKMKHVSSVLPEHHTASTRLLHKDT